MTPAARARRRGPVKVQHFDTDALIDNPRIRIIVCSGSGGVGKTTTAAAMALRAAERGRRTVVLTIDPARRLAQSMGLTELDNTPRQVPGVGKDGGRLDAMMLDMKRTFDEVVADHTTPEKARQIFANPFYQALSSSFAGTQEYMAMEKLGQLRHRDEWDLIVVDTPPSRSALDFLDAPERLGSFLDGRVIRLISAPMRAGSRTLRIFQAGFTIVTSTLTKILGGELLRDVQTFVSALDTMFGGFRERADQTYALLQRPETAFVVVAAPAPDALREASYFVERLSADAMPLAGLVLNRMHTDDTGGINEEQALAGAEHLEAAHDEHALTASLLRLHAERLHLAAADVRHGERFTAAHPDVPVTRVRALPTDVHDLDGLRQVGQLMAS
jgi:anion-transporting  ArsA/GET3 family ATPase